MIKYRQVEIFEIENGFIFKEIEPDNPKIVNQKIFLTTYCKDVDSIIDKIKSVFKP